MGLYCTSRAGAVPGPAWALLGMWHHSKAPVGLQGSELSVPDTLQTAEGNILLPGNPEKEVFFLRAAARRQPVMEASENWVFPLTSPLRRQSLGRWWWCFTVLGCCLGAGCTNPNSLSSL